MRLEEIQQAFRTGSATPTQVLRRCLDLIEEVDGPINSVVTLNHAAHAEATAAAARWAAGTPLSELDGVPFAAKDNLITAGVLTTWGSPAYADYLPTADELPVARLRAAGAVLVGKTNTPEFAALGATRNALFGRTTNPWDTALTPGGSSGGSAAAVAAGLVPFALGTDGGGSTRRPAAHTGIVGLKPSVGRVPRANGFPNIFHDLEVVGVLARQVGDLTPILRVLAASSPADPASAGFTPWSATRVDALTIDVALGVEDLPVDPEIRAATERAGTLLAELGHTVRHRSPLPLDLDELGRWGHPIMARGLARIAEERGSRFDQVEERFRAMAAEGTTISDAAERDAVARYDRFRRDINDLFGTADLLLTPTTAAQAWDVQQDYPDTIDGRPAGPRDHAQFTGWINAAALPAISVPAAFDKRGLPIGVQLIGKYGADELVVEVAYQFESALAAHGDWLGNPPGRPARNTS